MLFWRFNHYLLRVKVLHSLNVFIDFICIFIISGKLIGRYYDSNGEPTPYNYKIRKLIMEAKDSKEEINKQKLLYPPCNSEWSQDSGGRVWCSTLRY